MSQNQLYLQIAIWSQVVSSVVFLAALVFMWFKWLQPFVLAQQERSNQQIAEAERHRNEAKAALDALREEIDGAHLDATLIEQRAGEQAIHERQAVIAEANEAGERILHNAHGELERTRAAARQRLRGEFVEKALALARGDAGSRIDEPANVKLVDRFVTTLERGRGA